MIYRRWRVRSQTSGNTESSALAVPWKKGKEKGVEGIQLA